MSSRKALRSSTPLPLRAETMNVLRKGAHRSIMEQSEALDHSMLEVLPIRHQGPPSYVLNVAPGPNKDTMTALFTHCHICKHKEQGSS